MPRMDFGEGTERGEHLTRARLLRGTVGGVAGGLLAVGIAACGGGGETDTAAEPAEPTETSAATDFGKERDPFDPDVEEAFGPGDAGIANYALTLEYLEAEFYRQVVASNLFEGPQLALLREIGANEQQHVRAIKSLLKDVGAKAVDAPETAFELGRAEDVLILAADIENLGAAAYLGQATRVRNPDVLKLALSIHTTEGAHAAALATLIDRTITPDGSIAAPASGKEVLKSVEPFLVKS